MKSRKVKGGVLALVGFLLSPLTWWNDIFINIPLAYLFALPFAFFSRGLFLPAMIVGYWLTNILGFVLMHYGSQALVAKKQLRSKNQIIKDIIISVVYTLIIVLLVIFGVIQFPTEYLV